jgi:hypothetical protein
MGRREPAKLRDSRSVDSQSKILRTRNFVAMARIYQDMVTKDQQGSYRNRVADKKAMNVKEDPSFQDMFAQIRSQFGATDGIALPPDRAASLNKALTIAKWMAQSYRDKHPDTSIQDDMKQG